MFCLKENDNNYGDCIIVINLYGDEKGHPNLLRDDNGPTASLMVKNRVFFFTMPFHFHLTDIHDLQPVKKKNICI